MQSHHDYEPHQLCFTCLSLGHKGHVALHAWKPRSNKKRYIEDVADQVLETFKMSECKALSTPLLINPDLSLKNSPNVVDTELQLETENQAIVGSLCNNGLAQIWDLL